MKGPARRKCLCCQEFYLPDHRNLRHQRYCSKPACRKESQAQSQRRWLQRPENQNYFRGPENSQRVKDWRKRHPGYWRKKTPVHVALQEDCQEQLPPNEGVNSEKRSAALQEVFMMQPAVVVGLISMMTGHSLQENIVATARVLLRKGGTSWRATRAPKRLASMMKTKHLLCPQRLRRVPHQFSWIDQRLVRDGHITRCGGAQALALYLLLVTVADSQGLSYYSDKTAARLLSLREAELRQARNNLVDAGLIAYQAPLYQVLSLEPTLNNELSAPRTGQPLPISAILRQIIEQREASEQQQ